MNPFQYYTAVCFNVLGGAEPQGCIQVDRGTPVHMSANES